MIEPCDLSHSADSHRRQANTVYPAGKDYDGGGELVTPALTLRALGSERLAKAPLRGLEGAKPWHPGACADTGLSRLPASHGRRGTGPAAASHRVGVDRGRDRHGPY